MDVSCIAVQCSACCFSPNGYNALLWIGGGFIAGYFVLLALIIMRMRSLRFFHNQAVKTVEQQLRHKTDELRRTRERLATTTQTVDILRSAVREPTPN